MNCTTMSMASIIGLGLVSCRENLNLPIPDTVASLTLNPTFSIALFTEIALAMTLVVSASSRSSCCVGKETKRRSSA